MAVKTNVPFTPTGIVWSLSAGVVKVTVGGSASTAQVTDEAAPALPNSSTATTVSVWLPSVSGGSPGDSGQLNTPLVGVRLQRSGGAPSSEQKNDTPCGSLV